MREQASVMKASNLFVAVDAVYPLALAVTFLGSSIVVKVRDGRAPKRQSTQISRSRCNWIFRLQFLLSVNILTAIVLALRSASDGYAAHVWDSTSHLASSIAVFLFLAAGLLPGPDTPYQPSLSNAHSWLMALGFETGLAIAYSVWCPPQVTKNGMQDEQSLRIAILILAYLRVVFLCGASALFFSPSRATNDPESAGLLAGNTEEGTYGTVQSGPKEPTSPGDAQSTNWLDYLVGFGQLMPLIWPTDSISLQIRACICVVILILQRVVNVLVPFQLGEVVTTLGTGQIPYKELSIYIACRAVQGQQGVLAATRALLWIPIGQATYRRLTQSAFEHVMSLSLQFHLGKKLGEVTSALSKGSALNTFIDSLIFQLFPMVADIGVAAAYFLVKFHPFYSLIILTVGGTYLFITIYMAKYRGRARRDMVTRDREMDAIKTDAIMSYEVVHYNGALQAEKSRFANRMEGFQKSEMSVLVSLNLLNAAQNMIFTFGVVMVSFLSAWRISIGAEAVAMFVSLLAYLAQLQAPLGFFGSFYTQIQNNLIDAERMLSLFEEAPSVIDKPGARAITDCKGHITFDKVSFAYDPRRQALHDLSLDIRPGTSVAIVGESGSGKSTLLRLLFRFYDVTSGQILLDGVNVEDITIQSLRNHFGVVPQDTILFNDTLMYNLLYAKPDATDEEIFAACRAASVHDKILALPDGYNTQVGERGLRLSGGEKQRISIARTILKSPTIILMDEATASLDSETERAIQSSLAEISAGRTTITIAHRLSTIVDSDQIVVLHNGRVVEQGTHSQLLIRNGRYRKMWEKQTKDSGSDKGQPICS